MTSKIENELGIPEDETQRAGLIDRLQQYVEAEPKAWHVRYNLALALSQEGRLDEALAQFREVLAVSPKHLETMINIGGIHLSRGEGDMALKVFTSALQVWDLPVVRANLGMAYLQLGHLDEAERAFNAALEANPNMVETWGNLGALLLQSGRLEDSVRVGLKAVELNPRFAMAHNNLAVAFLELGRDEEAKTAAAKALELGYPVHPELLKQLGL